MNATVPPAGFTVLHHATETWWVKTGWEHVIPVTLEEVWKPPPDTGLPVAGGRGLLQYRALPDGSRAVIRRYRRGGFVRHFIHDIYWDRPLRPFAELTGTEMARQRGVPTVTVLAAGVKHLGLGLYRGVLISREAVGFVNLWEWLHTEPTAEQRKLGIAAVAGAVVQLHKAGIFHTDLNLTNLLVRTTETVPEVFVIDFDKAQVFLAALPSHAGQQMLRRLQRSLHKLDPQRRFVSAAEETLFCQAYTQALTP